MLFFFEILDTNKEWLINEALGSGPHTPKHTHSPSEQEPSLHTADPILSSREKKRHYHFPHFHFGSPTFPEHGQENVVGVFESQKYLDLEARLMDPDAERLTTAALHLLVESCAPLANACTDGVQFLVGWYQSVNDSRFASIFSRKKRRTWEESVQESEGAAETLSQAIRAFRTNERSRFSF